MNIRPLIPELQKKCTEELHEVSDRVPEDLNSIRQWLSKQLHLSTRTDDQWLLSFLRGSKFHLERTKEKLDYFYTSRTLWPEVFCNRDPLLPEMQEILKEGVIIILPKPTGAAGEKIIFCRVNRYDPSRMRFDNLLKVFFMMFDLLLKDDDNFIISGLHLLIDMTDLNLNHIKSMNPIVMKKATICIQKTYPTRLKGFHYLNVQPIFEPFLKLTNPFMSNKLIKRITTYPKEDLTKLFDVIPKEVLPIEYGGEEQPIKQLTEELKIKIESCRDWFLGESRYGSIENQRLNNVQNVDNLFGINGLFQKLNID